MNASPPPPSALERGRRRRFVRVASSAQSLEFHRAFEAKTRSFPAALLCIDLIFLLFLLDVAEQTV
jgi:hypothetical protein